MKYKFIILSNQNYDFELKTNKWQIANKLSEKGYSVVFVDPPLRFRALKKFIKAPSLSLGKLFAGVDRKSDNLIVYKPANIFNFKPFSSWNTIFHLKNIVKLADKKENENLILWIYHFDYPDLESFVQKLDHDLMLYDCVDEYTEFPEYSEGKKVNPTFVSFIQKFDDKLKVKFNQNGLKNVEWVLHREKWLSDNADLVWVSAPGLVDKFSRWGRKAYYLPNGGAYELFNPIDNSFSEPKDIKGIAHPRVCFSGAIDTYKNNINLIEKCAESLPKYNFIMIGPQKVSDPDLDLSKLESMKNVHFLGIKEYTDLPSYFAYSDAYFIPYNLNEYMMKGCFPTKYFDSLAAGLPTIVTDMPAYNGYDVDGYVANDDNDFIEKISIGIKEDSAERKKKRIALAKENSWDGKVNKQINLINKKFTS